MTSLTVSIVVFSGWREGGGNGEQSTFWLSFAAAAAAVGWQAGVGAIRSDGGAVMAPTSYAWIAVVGEVPAL